MILFNIKGYEIFYLIPLFYFVNKCLRKVDSKLFKDSFCGFITRVYKIAFTYSYTLKAFAFNEIEVHLITFHNF
nr:MAG TPA: hypothetical protein [Caudoviricetes sp.]